MTYTKWVSTSFMRAALGGLSISQQQALQPLTADAYTHFMKKSGLQPDFIELGDGTKACWMGDKLSGKVLLWFHGGAYVAAASNVHFLWMQKLIAKANETGSQLAVIVLQYDLAPMGVYPTQLRQAVLCLRYLLETSAKAPSDIIIGGDSAGGGLAAVLMAHLCHPHPLIPAIQLKCPIKGAILVSPWVTFDQKSGSMKENEQMDILSKRFLQHASVAFLSNAAVTVYNTPKSGDTVFWSDLREKIANVRVIAGGLELFVDDVQEFVDTIKTTTHDSVELFVQDFGQHVPPLADIFWTRNGSSSIKLGEWICEFVASP